MDPFRFPALKVVGSRVYRTQGHAPVPRVPVQQPMMPVMGPRRPMVAGRVIQLAHPQRVVGGRRRIPFPGRGGFPLV